MGGGGGEVGCHAHKATILVSNTSMSSLEKFTSLCRWCVKKVGKTLV